MFLLPYRVCLLAIGLVTGVPVHGAEVLPGPYRASVERVIDTIAVRVIVWLQQDIRVAAASAASTHQSCEANAAPRR